MDSFVIECKALINKDNLEGLQEMYEDYKHEPFAWEYIYQKVYLHACLKKKQRIVAWLKGLMTELDPIQQIGIRQMVSYGNYLLRK